MADLFYYETGYIDEKYFGYIADAVIPAGPYIVEGWMEDGYWEDYSAQCTLSCIGDVTRGEEVPANGSWTSSSTMSITANKSVEGNITLSSTFSQTAYGARERDIDLFAFTEGALASQVQAIREYELDAESAFDVATDYIRYRDTSSDADVEFSQVVDNERSRAFNIETQAAFSLSAVIDDLTKEGEISLTSEFTGFFAGGFTFETSAALPVYANVFVSRNAGPGAPVTVTGSFNSTHLINSATRSSDLTNLPNADNWFYETNLYVQPNGNWQNIDVGTLFNIPLGTLGTLTASIRYRSSTGVIVTVGNGSKDLGDALGSSIPQYIRISVSFTGGQKFAYYVNGDRVGVISDVNTSGWTITNPVSVQFAPSYPLTVSSVVHNCYTDNAWLTYGDYTNNGTDTYIYPIDPLVNTENTIFLYQFNGNGVQQTALTFNGQSSLTSTSTTSAKLSGPVHLSSNLTSSTNLTATISHIQGADLTAFSDAALSVDVQKLKNADAITSAEFSQSTGAVKTAEFSSEHTSDFTVDTTALRIQESSVAIESAASQLTAVVRLAGLFADDLTESFLSVDPVVTRDAESVIESTATQAIDFTRVRFNESAVSAEFNSSADADVRLTTSADLVSESTVTFDIFKYTGIVSNQSSEFTVVARGSNSGKIEATLFESAALSVTPSITRETSVEALTNDVVLESFATSLLVGESTFTSETSLTAVNDRRRNTSAALEVTGAELALGVKTVKISLAVNINSTVSATVRKIIKPVLTLTTQSTVSAAAVKTSRITKTLSSTATLYAGGTSSKDTTANLTVQGFELIAAVKTGDFDIDLTSTASMTVAGVVLRSATMTVSSTATTSVAIMKIVKTSSTISSTSTVSAIATNVLKGQASITSAMTFVAQVRELVIDDIVYVIPAEIWEYEIAGETGQYSIGSETREYIII